MIGILVTPSFASSDTADSHPLIFFAARWIPMSVLLDAHDILAHRVDPMDNVNLDDVILFLLPHKGEGFEGAAFATSMPENKSRFVEARHNIPRPRSIPRHEREETVLPVEYGLLENTN